MAITLTPITVTPIERTYRCERVCPTSGAADYRIRILRELAFKDAKGNLVGNTTDLGPVVDELSSLTMTRPCTAAYLKACQAAKTADDLMAAEVAWYDALVTAVRAGVL